MILAAPADLLRAPQVDVCLAGSSTALRSIGVIMSVVTDAPNFRAAAPAREVDVVAVGAGLAGLLPLRLFKGFVATIGSGRW